MTLDKACTHILSQLDDLIRQIRQEDFSKPSDVLNGSTIGQHLRHTLEFFICFEKGYMHGTVNYDQRLHDRLIETDKFIAMDVLSGINQFVSSLELNKSLKLEVSYDPVKDSFLSVDTNALRELVYNIEHAVHHMAIMKIGIREIAPYITLSQNFGIAASTVRYQETRSALEK